MKARLAAAAVALALLAVPALAPPAAAAGALAGAGSGTTLFTFCNPNVYVALAGAEAADGLWTMTFTIARQPAAFCLPVIGGVFEGPWSAEAGGCLPGTADPTQQLCLEPRPAIGPGLMGWTLCSYPGPCHEPTTFMRGTLTTVGA